jgi:hypothetical protein
MTTLPSATRIEMSVDYITYLSPVSGVRPATSAEIAKSGISGWSTVYTPGWWRFDPGGVGKIAADIARASTVASGQGLALVLFTLADSDAQTFENLTSTGGVVASFGSLDNPATDGYPVDGAHSYWVFGLTQDANPAIRLMFSGPGSGSWGPQIILDPFSVTAAVGKTVTLKSLAGGNPAPTPKWQRIAP